VTIGLDALAGLCMLEVMTRRAWGIALIVLGFVVLSVGAALATVLILASGALIALAGSWLVWRQFPLA
jgi:hypothetical protein